MLPETSGPVEPSIGYFEPGSSSPSSWENSCLALLFEILLKGDLVKEVALDQAAGVSPLMADRRFAHHLVLLIEEVPTQTYMGSLQVFLGQSCLRSLVWSAQ